MAFNTELTSDQLGTLRGTSALAPFYAGSIYLSTCPNENVYTARVNQASFTASFAQVTYDGGSGTLADIVDGMTVLISHTNDRSKAFFTGRIRKTPSMTVLYINETSAPIADNDYIFVLDDFAIRDKLGRMVSGVLKHDYEINFRQLPPVIYGLKSAYADNIDTITEVYEIVFPLTALAATSGATIDSWVLDFADGTITDGDETTPTVTVEFEEGFRWIYITSIDDGARSTTRKIPVWAHGPNYTPELINAGNIQVTASVAGGVDATITAFAGVDSILDNTLVVAWSVDEIYQDFEGSLVGNNIAFVGRLRKHTDTTRTDEEAVIDSERQYTIEGALTQLARIEQLPYEMLNKASSPTLFGQIVNMTLWRGIVYLLAECSTFLELHSLYLEDTSNTYLAPTRNPVGNILNAINDLAGSVNSAVQINYSGNCEIVLDLRMGTTSQRNTAVNVADWNASDILDIQYEHSHVRTIGRLKASGGSYNSVSNQYATFESLAPGVAQDYPEGSSSLDRQVLTANAAGTVAQLELNTRAGNAFERAQENDTLTVTFPDGYHSVLIPALNQWHTFTVDDDAINIHLDDTIRWLLTEVTISHNSAEGTKEVRAVFNRESVGSPGQTVVFPVPAEVPLLEPTFPPFQPYDMYPIDMGDILGADPIIVYAPVGNEIPTDGNALIVYTAAHCLVVVNAINNPTPGTRDATPTLHGAIMEAKLGAGKDAYLLETDGETSWVHYTEDIFAGEVVWVVTEITGHYTELDTTATQGEVYIYGRSGVCADYVITFDSMGDSPYTILEGSIDTGTGWMGSDALTGEIISGDVFEMLINIPVDEGCEIASVYFRYNASNTRPIQDVGLQANYYDADDNVLRNAGNPSLSGAADGTWREFSDMPPGGLTGVAYIKLQLNWAGASIYGVDAVMDEITIGVGGGVGGDGETRFSDDFAVTFASAEAVGTVPGEFTGLATSKIGSQILVSGFGQTTKASDGGSYADYGTAHAQGAYFIPRYIFSSTSSGNTGASPEYLLFAPELDSGESMWRVTAGGNTFFDVTPIRSGTEGLAVGHRCTAMFWRTGYKIVAIAEFGGSVRRLCCTDDGGATWTFSGTLDGDSVALTTRKSDTASKQVFIGNGPNLGICFDAFAATPLISNRNLGLTDNIIGVQVYG